MRPTIVTLITIAATAARSSWVAGVSSLTPTRDAAKDSSPSLHDYYLASAASDQRYSYYFDYFHCNDAARTTHLHRDSISIQTEQIQAAENAPSSHRDMVSMLSSHL